MGTIRQHSPVAYDGHVSRLHKRRTKPRETLNSARVSPVLVHALCNVMYSVNPFNESALGGPVGYLIPKEKENPHSDAC